MKKSIIILTLLYIILTSNLLLANENVEINYIKKLVHEQINLNQKKDGFLLVTNLKS